MRKMINVCDAIMGAGKSSSAITYMNEHPDRPFIYITPYLDEAARIKESCPELRFIEPSKGIPEFGFTKTGHTLRLVEERRNIATTHQAFKFYTPELLDLIRQNEYTLIIDESVNVLDEVKIDPADIEVLCRAGYITDDDGILTVKDHSYDGVLFQEIFRLMKSRCLIRNTGGEDDKVFYYWMLPPTLIQAFKDVFILTYLFEGQSIHHFLEIHKMPYRYIGTEKDERGVFRFCDERRSMPEYTAHLSRMIHICDDAKLNAIGEDASSLSMNWFRRSDDVEQLKNHIYNYFRHITGDDMSGVRMWGTFDKQRSSLRGKGYTNKFLIFNERATNNYADRRVLAYAVNLFMNVDQKHFYQRHGAVADDDIYALSTMIQWIWRSAIRNGEEIWIYIPSRRMRSLLINWIADVENQYRAFALEKAGDRVA